MKIAIFRNENALEITRQVNDFIRDKEIVEIKYNTSVLYTKFNTAGQRITPLGAQFYDSVFITYEE